MATLRVRREVWWIAAPASLVVLFLLVWGRDASVPSAAPAPSEVGLAEGADAAGDPRALLTRLIDVPSVDLLKALLQRNGVATAGILRIGTTTAYNPGDEKLLTAVRDAGWIQSNGMKLAIVCAIVEANKRDVPIATPSVPIVYAFRDDGRLAALIGSRDYMSKESAKSITVASLGTKESWFALVERWDFKDNEFRYQDCYLLGDPIEKVLEVRHLYDSLGHTGTEEQAKLSGPFIGFTRTKSFSLQHDSLGFGTNGISHEPRLRWIAAENKFRGSSTMKYNGEYLYEVNVKESIRFEPTDLGDK